MSAEPELIVVEEPGSELALRDPGALAVRPEVTAQDLVARLGVIREAMQQAMERDVDYGVIPGTGKPALLKPGAEKLGALFQLDVQLENEKIWHEDGHLTVIARAQVFHQPTGTRLGGGEGICTSREEKYAFRGGARLCPSCGQAAIKRSKCAPRSGDYPGASAQDEPGWYCFAKVGGCGANFKADDPAIVSQSEAKQPHPNIADTWNTVDKMASKRARIDAVLAVTGASALFTQDVEPTPGEPPAPTTVPAPAPEPAPAPTPRKASTRQTQKIAILRDELLAAGAFDEPQYRAVLQAEYGVGSATELTNGQASELISRLQAKQAGAAA